MFKASLLALSIVSLTASACPNLQGVWLCKDAANPAATQTSSIMQQTVNGVTTYQISGNDNTQIFVTDGQDQTQTDAAHGATMTNNAHCTGDTHLIGTMKAKSTTPRIEMDSVFDFELTSEKAMKASANVKYNIEGNAGTQAQTILCTHN